MAHESLVRHAVAAFGEQHETLITGVRQKDEADTIFLLGLLGIGVLEELSHQVALSNQRKALDGLVVNGEMLHVAV